MFADGGASAPCWLVCDAEAMNRYGGMGLTFGYLAACDIAERLSGNTSHATPPGDEHVLRTAHLHH